MLETLLPMPETLGDGVELLKDIPYALPGGYALKLDVYRPAQRPSPLPALLFLHGGGWRHGTKEDIRPHAEAMARLGYLAASAQYRLSQIATFPAALHDTKAAIRWLRQNAVDLGADPARIGLVGYSAGATLVALAGLTTETADLDDPGADRTVPTGVRCVIPFFGPYDLLMGVTIAPEQDPVRVFIGADPEKNPEAFRRASAIRYVSTDSPPFLLMHGRGDPIVPIGQSRRFHEAFRAVGATAELFEWDSDVHTYPWNLGKPEDCIGILREFCGRWL